MQQPPTIIPGQFYMYSCTLPYAQAEVPLLLNITGCCAENMNDCNSVEEGNHKHRSSSPVN